MSEEGVGIAEKTPREFRVFSGTGARMPSSLCCANGLSEKADLAALRRGEIREPLIKAGLSRERFSD